MENIFIKTVLEILPRPRINELIEEYKNCEIGDSFVLAYRNVLSRHPDKVVCNGTIDLFIDALEKISGGNYNVKTSK